MIIIVAKQLGKLNPIDYSAEVSHALNRKNLLFLVPEKAYQSTIQFQSFVKSYRGHRQRQHRGTYYHKTCFFFLTKEDLET